MIPLCSFPKQPRGLACRDAIPQGSAGADGHHGAGRDGGRLPERQAPSRAGAAAGAGDALWAERRPARALCHLLESVRDLGCEGRAGARDATSALSGGVGGLCRDTGGPHRPELARRPRGCDHIGAAAARGGAGAGAAAAIGQRYADGGAD